jgi:hypothetical protein
MGETNMGRPTAMKCTLIVFALLLSGGCGGAANNTPPPSGNGKNWIVMLDGHWTVVTGDSAQFVNYELNATGEVLVGTANYPIFDNNNNVTSFASCPVKVVGSVTGTTQQTIIPNDATVTMSDCFTSATHTVPFTQSYLGNQSSLGWHGFQSPYTWNVSNISVTADGSCSSPWNLAATFAVPFSTMTVNGFTVQVADGNPTATVNLTLTSGKCSLPIITVTGPMKGGSFISTDGSVTIQEVTTSHYQFLIKPPVNAYGVTQLSGSN